MDFRVNIDELLNCDRDKELIVIRAIVQILRALCTKDGELRQDLTECVACDFVEADTPFVHSLFSSLAASKGIS